MLVLEFHGLEKVESILAAEQEGFNQADLLALNGGISQPAVSLCSI